MTYSIIGAGAIGSALASQFVRAQIAVQLTSRSDAQALGSVARKLGPNVAAVPVDEALQADTVFLAVPFGAVADVVAGAGPWGKRIVVDCTNAIELPAFTPMDLGGTPSSAINAEHVRDARLVKAFNTVPAAVLATPARVDGGRRVIFLSGDEGDAKIEVARLIERFGFAPIDLGTLSGGGRLQQFGGPLSGLNLIRLTDASH